MKCHLVPEALLCFWEAEVRDYLWLEQGYSLCIAMNKIRNQKCYQDCPSYYARTRQASDPNLDLTPDNICQGQLKEYAYYTMKNKKFTITSEN